MIRILEGSFSVVSKMIPASKMYQNVSNIIIYIISVVFEIYMIENVTQYTAPNAMLALPPLFPNI